MNQPPIALIVAMDERGCIGANGTLPWHLPADLQHFKSCTMGKPMVMGRKTFESLGRVLPGRLHVVMSQRPAPQEVPRGVLWVHDQEAALHAARNANKINTNEIMVIGGAAIFTLFLPMASRLYLTCIHATFAGDRFFPEPEPLRCGWRETARHTHAADARNAHAMTFVTYER
jgi:dihydrofolate reductase